MTQRLLWHFFFFVLRFHRHHLYRRIVTTLMSDYSFFAQFRATQYSSDAMSLAKIPRYDSALSFVTWRTKIFCLAFLCLLTPSYIKSAMTLNYSSSYNPLISLARLFDAWFVLCDALFHRLMYPWHFPSYHETLALLYPSVTTRLILTIFLYWCSINRFMSYTKITFFSTSPLYIC